MPHFHFSRFCCLCPCLRRSSIHDPICKKRSCIPEAFDSPNGPAIKGEAAKGIALTSAAVSGPCQAGQDDPTVHVTMFALRPVVLLKIEATFQDYAWGSQSTRWAGHRGESRTSYLLGGSVLIRWQPHDSCPTSDLLVAMQTWLVMRSCWPLFSDGVRP